MVERYKQPGLPSPVVATPGVNQAAGAAAGDVAKLGEQMTNEQFAAARNIGQAGGQIDQSIMNVVRGVGESRQLLIAAQTRQAVANSAPGAANDAFNFINQKIQQYSGDPNDPTKPYTLTPEQLKEDYSNEILGPIKERTKNNPQIQAAELERANMQYSGIANHLLNVWAPGAVTTNVQIGTAKAPLEAQKIIDAGDPTATIPDMLATNKQAMSAISIPVNESVQQAHPSSGIYQATAASSPGAQQRLSPSAYKIIAAKGAQAQNSVSVATLHKMFNSITSTQEGANRIQQIKGILDDPQKSGMYLTEAQQNKGRADLERIEKGNDAQSELLAKIQNSRDVGNVTFKYSSTAKVANDKDSLIKLSGQVQKDVLDTHNEIEETNANYPNGKLKLLKMEGLHGRLEALDQALTTINLRQNDLNTKADQAVREAQGEKQLGIEEQRLLGQQDTQKLQQQKFVANQEYYQRFRTLLNEQRGLRLIPAGPQREAAAHALGAKIDALSNWHIENHLASEGSIKELQKFKDDSYGLALYKHIDYGVYSTNIQSPARTSKQQEQNKTDVAKQQQEQQIQHPSFDLSEQMMDGGDIIGTFSPLKPEQKSAAQAYLCNNLRTDLDSQIKRNPTIKGHEAEWIQKVYVPMLEQQAMKNGLSNQAIQRAAAIKIPVSRERRKAEADIKDHPPILVPPLKPEVSLKGAAAKKQIELDIEKGKSFLKGLDNQ